MIDLNDVKTKDCPEHMHQAEWIFKDGQCYRDGVYFGDVIYSDQSMIQVLYKGNNMYMQGHISTFNLFK